jgi:hypothetical protein
MPKYRKLPMEQLFIDDRYQRELSQRRVAKMADQFDENKIGVLEVSQRKPDKYAVFDGQHRLAVLERIGANDAPCLVHEGLTPRQEAELFVSIQTERKRPQAVERFIAEVFAQEPTTLAIWEILQERGIEVGMPQGKGSQSDLTVLGAVTAALRVFEAGNLAETLDVLLTAWEGERKLLDANMLEGMSAFLTLYGPRISEGDLLDKMQDTTPTEIIRRASAKKQTTGGTMRELIVEELRSRVSGSTKGQGALRRSPLAERTVALRNLKLVREALQPQNGSYPILSQAELTQRTNIRSQEIGPVLKTLQTVGQIRQRGTKKVQGNPASPAYQLAKVRKDAPAT